jgi:hypothetical protein
MRGYGKVVKLAHAGGFVSLYAHQSRILVRRGSYVKRGQVIGRVGSTGRSTGPHLHFGLYRNGRAIDPLKYLGRSGTNVRIRRITTRHKKMEEYTIVKTKRVPIPGAKALKKRLLVALKAPPRAFSWEAYAGNFIVVDPSRLRGSEGVNLSKPLGMVAVGERGNHQIFMKESP